MIRASQNDDITEIMDIWLSTNLSAHSFIPQDYWHNSFALVRDVYLPAAQTYVYLQEGRPLAFLSILEHEFIGALFVRQEHQGKGIGKQLMEHAKALYPKLSLAVYAQNYGAVNFYHACGFAQVLTRPNEDSGFEEHLMTWTK